MKKLNLNEYTDEEIVRAVFRLDSFKFISVFKALEEVSNRIQTRGETLAKNFSDDLIEEFFKRLNDE